MTRTPLPIRTANQMMMDKIYEVAYLPVACFLWTWIEIFPQPTIPPVVFLPGRVLALWRLLRPLGALLAALLQL